MMATKVIMPQASDSMEEGTVGRWLKREGDAVTRGEVIAEIESDKAVLEVEAFTDGILYRTFVEEGATVPVRTVIAIIAAPGEMVDVDGLVNEAAAPPPPEAPAPPPPVRARRISRSGVRATPRAKRLAREHGVDLAEVSGTGPEGAIQERDILAHLDADNGNA